MPDLVALRERALDLIDRKSRLREAALAACTARVVLTRAMQDHVVAEIARDYEDDPPEPRAVFRHDVGQAMPLFTDGALQGIIGGGSSGDYARSVFVSNTRMSMAEVIRIGESAPGVTRGEEPDLSGLTPFEVGALVNAYTTVIEDMTEALRDAHTRIRQLRRLKSPLPGYVKGACIGMFGGSDSGAFTYDEGDFTRYNTVYEPIPPGDPAYRPGTVNERRIDLHPEVFSARYLAPFLGDDEALRVEAAFRDMEAATAPLPGEPPVLTHFSSHATNRIPVAYAAGETDLGVLPASAPRP